MAITGVTGETVTSLISHYDKNNDPILGANFTVVAAHRPDGETFEVEFNEIGGGAYEVVVRTNYADPPGEWLLSIQANNGFRYDEVFDLTGYYAGRRP